VARFNRTLEHTDLVRFRVPPTTTTTLPPTTTTTAAPAPATTTTAAPAPTTTTTAAPAPQPVATSSGNSQSGDATYYASYFPDNGCASPFLPKGTVLTVTAASGTVVCTVDDKEDDSARVVDLSPAQFSQLAPLSQGVVQVTVSW
jgi:rare lipoprotein A (peptidoglycan hydrolase)